VIALQAPLALLLASLSTTGLSAQDAPSPRRPNLLLLLTDDQRWDTLGCAGNPRAQTPNLDELARDGVRFRNAFVTTAICAASRASILTGLHERTHRYTFGTPPLRDEHLAASYPAQLRASGYRTGLIGKFGVRTPPGATARLFDVFVPLSPNPYLKRQPDGSERHLCDLTGDRAVEFLAGCKADQPWCLSISFNEPHAEDGDPRQYFWPRAFDDSYADTVFPVPRTMADAFFAAQPEFLRTSESRTRFLWRFDQPQKYQDMVRGYYRMIAGVDAVVGRLRRELRARGLADDTVIVFTSDNGYFLGERGFADKWYAYEPSIRVPLLIADPRAPAQRRGTTCDLMALNIDLAPTLLECAGLTAPAAYQGHSLRPLTHGRAPVDWRTDFFYEHLFDHAKIPKSEGVRTERFTYLRWIEQQPLREELYDHQVDFDQRDNLATASDYAAVLAALRQRTDALRDRYGGPWQRQK
jgi:arylsulfatase A-like enzyme